MATVTNTREVLKVEGKVNMIRTIENRKKKNLTCVNVEFSFVNRTIQRIWKTRIKIISAFQQNGLRIKRFRKPEGSGIDEALYKWLQQQKSGNATVSGPLRMITSVLTKF
jgi:hypothetical protein